MLHLQSVTETWSAEDEEDDFGDKRLAALVCLHRDKDVAGIEIAILKELETFAKGAKTTDDSVLKRQ